jgi:hypothetical protein
MYTFIVSYFTYQSQVNNEGSFIMYHVYCGKDRITSSPVSYNHVIKNIFQRANLDWKKLSSLPIGECYSYDEYKIVRVS